MVTLMSKPRLLDLYSGAGGAAMGYFTAGFEVVGVDIKRQPRYPFEFHQADALDFLAQHGHEFDAIHASPPCQRYTVAQHISRNAAAHEDLVEPTRDMLETLGKPYIIENVPGSPVKHYVQLCGSEFYLRAVDDDGTVVQLRRHRRFESNVYLLGAGGCQHPVGMPVASVYGEGGGWSAADRRNPERGGGYVPATRVCNHLMQIDWMNKKELSEAIPPAYTEFLGYQLLRYV